MGITGNGIHSAYFVKLRLSTEKAISIGGFTYLAVCPDPGTPLNGARSGEDLSEGAPPTKKTQFVGRDTGLRLPGVMSHVNKVLS